MILRNVKVQIIKSLRNVKVQIIISFKMSKM